MTQLDEVFFANGNVIAEEGGDPNLVWKTVLSPGRLELTPGPGGKRLKKPLVIIEGHSNDPSQEIGIADLLESFEQGAIQHVTIPTSHDNKVLENTGYVRKMRMVQEDGKNVLQAGLEFTEPEVLDRVKRGSIANVSCGILRNYEKQRDGKSFKAVIDHIALTNRPWVDGMKPFSENTDLDPKGFYFADEIDLSTYIAQDHKKGDYVIRETILDDKPDRPTEAVVWDTSMSMVTRQRLLEDALDASYPDCMLVDFTTSKCLLDAEGGKQFVAGYALRDDGSVRIHPQEEWAQTSSSNDFSETPKGGDNPMDEVKLAELTAQLEAAEAKIAEAEARATEFAVKVAEAEKKERVANVKERVRELSALGLSAYPGFLGVVEEVMLSDDGDVALNLSEDGETKHLTATDVVERLIGALPKDDEGNLKLSEQHIKIDDDDVNPGNVPEPTAAERAEAMKKFLGMDDPKTVLQ